MLGLVFIPFEEAQADEPRYKPRIEVGARLGTERSLAVTEAWAPLAQGDDRVLYGDARLMGDNDDNQEWNLGVGYRQLTEDGTAVLGAHAWIDRRKTARGSTFHQATAGFELLTDDLDVRANAYLPANESYSYETGSTGPSTPYLADTGIYYNTSGAIIESALRGLDLELSIPLPLFENNLESVRLSGGGFVFRGDDVETMRGSRVRATAEITPDVQIGARFENDNLRGSQGFLEATLRFPFGSKASGKTLGLRGRLDESPERDVDVISGETIDTGQRPVLSTFNGQAQRVFHVDNTASAGGDGSLERPFSTLAAANAAADRAGDVIYVNSGDGTTAGMDQGVTLAQNGQVLIGSGRAFVYDSGRFTASNGGSFSGTQLKAAGTAPNLTNVNASADGVLVTADDVLLSGFTAQGATRDGIRILNASDTLAEGVSTNTNTGIGFYAISNDGQARSNIYLDDIIADSNGSYGVLISAENAGSSWDTITIQDANAEDNVQTGITVLANNGGQILNATLSEITANRSTDVLSRGIVLGAVGANSIISYASLDTVSVEDNARQGLFIMANSGGQITDLNLDNITANNNINAGVYIETHAAGSGINSAALNNIISSNNIGRGVYFSASGTAQVGTATFDNITANNNTNTGLYVQATGGGSAITSASLQRIISSGNTGASGRGVYVLASSAGLIGNATLQDITASNNTQPSVHVQANATGQIGTATLQDITTNNNTNTGVYFLAQTGGNIGTATLSDITSTGNTGAQSRGVYIAATTASQIGSATLQDITASNNAQHGFHVYALDTSLISASLEHVTATGNASHGVFIDDDTTGTFVADLGGGALGSTGQNRIFSNTGTDIRVDLDNLQLKAENNWWGDAAGLLAARRTLDGTSTIDANPFLAIDPGP